MSPNAKNIHIMQRRLGNYSGKKLRMQWFTPKRESMGELMFGKAEVERKTLVRNACNNVFTPSFGRASLRLEMLCVATMGMHFGCRDRDRKRSSPVGLSPPTVAKFWYSSQMKTVGRKCRSGCSSISGIRSRTDRW